MSLISAGSISLDSTFNMRKKQVDIFCVHYTNRINAYAIVQVSELMLPFDTY